VCRESAADRLRPTRARLLPAQPGGPARRQRPYYRSYRDAFELLFGFVEHRTGKSPSALTLADLDAPLVLDFLDHLETERGNTTRTRNARLAAIHSFMRYAALRDPASLPITGRVLAIPAKRFDRPMLGYLTREQVAAILAAPNRRTWSGHRDAVLLATAYNTGARVSELIALRVRDVLLERNTAVHLHGKGRKQRAIPLWKNTATELRAWLDRTSPAPDAPMFPNRAGAPLTRSGVRDRLDRAVAAAEQRCPSLHGQHVSPHTLRHSTAMHLLQSGTDLPVIALWLGHSSPAATHQYLEAKSRRQGNISPATGRPQSHTNTIPPRRPTPRIAARPLIMCTHTIGNHHAERGPPTELHITTN
jgi:integrase/recombinase XerD